ncbi:T9SS type A sorting domain-containing protein [bacterium]|nr:T9SS type A sorting domain-containing protein [bacterium]
MKRAFSVLCLLFACVAAQAQLQPPQIEFDWMRTPYTPTPGYYRGAHDVLFEPGGGFTVLETRGASGEPGHILYLTQCNEEGSEVQSLPLLYSPDVSHFNDLIRLSDGSVVVSGSLKEYFVQVDHAFLGCIRPDYTIAWQHRYNGLYDGYGYSLGDVGVKRPAAEDDTLIYQVRYHEYYNNSEHKWIELYTGAGVLVDTLSIPPGQQDRDFDLILTLDSGNILFSEYMTLGEYSITGQSVLWTVTPPASIEKLIHSPRVGCIASIVSNTGETSSLIHYSDDGAVLWQQDFPGMKIKDIAYADSLTLVYAAYPFQVSGRMELGRINQFGEVMWTWEGRQNYQPVALDVGPGGQLMVAGTSSGYQDTNYFLARFQLPNPNRPPEDSAPPSVSISPLNVYPNPFNASASIRVMLDRAAPVTMRMVDLLGRSVQTVYDNRMLTAGEHRVTVDGAELPSGTYFLQLQSGDSVPVTQRITLVK